MSVIIINILFAVVSVYSQFQQKLRRNRPTVVNNVSP